MTNLAEQRTLSQATTRRSHRCPPFGFVPILAVAIGAWLAWDALSKEGPTTRISFDTGEGCRRASRSSNTKTSASGRLKASNCHRTLDSDYGDNTKFHRDLDRLMVHANKAVSTIRALADLLARDPEALIKGRPAGPIE